MVEHDPEAGHRVCQRRDVRELAGAHARVEREILCSQVAGASEKRTGEREAGRLRLKEPSNADDQRALEQQIEARGHGIPVFQRSRSDDAGHRMVGRER